MQLDDERLQDLWHGQPGPTVPAAALMIRVERHRRARALRRALEVAISVAGIVALTWPGEDGGLSPRQWLLIPFFAVFLVVCWTLLLRGGAEPRAAALESGAIYARLRQLQIRQALHSLKLADHAACALVVYALAALGGVLAFGVDVWREAGWVLVAWAVLWFVATRWLTRRRRRACVREYRAMQRLR